MIFRNSLIFSLLFTFCNTSVWSRTLPVDTTGTAVFTTNYDSLLCQQLSILDDTSTLGKQISYHTIVVEDGFYAPLNDSQQVIINTWVEEATNQFLCLQEYNNLQISEGHPEKCIFIMEYTPGKQVDYLLPGTPWIEMEKGTDEINKEIIPDDSETFANLNTFNTSSDPAVNAHGVQIYLIHILFPENLIHSTLPNSIQNTDDVLDYLKTKTNGNDTTVIKNLVIQLSQKLHEKSDLDNNALFTTQNRAIMTMCSFFTQENTKKDHFLIIERGIKGVYIESVRQCLKTYLSSNAASRSTPDLWKFPQPYNFIYSIIEFEQGQAEDLPCNVIPGLWQQLMGTSLSDYDFAANGTTKKYNQLTAEELDFLHEALSDFHDIVSSMFDGVVNPENFSAFIALVNNCQTEYAQQMHGIIPNCIWKNTDKPGIPIACGIVDGAYDFLVGLVNVVQGTPVVLNCLFNPMEWIGESSCIETRKNILKVATLIGEVITGQNQGGFTATYESMKKYIILSDGASLQEDNEVYHNIGHTIFDVLSLAIGVGEVNAGLKVLNLTSKIEVLAAKAATIVANNSTKFRLLLSGLALQFQIEATVLYKVTAIAENVTRTEWVMGTAAAVVDDAAQLAAAVRNGGGNVVKTAVQQMDEIAAAANEVVVQGSVLGHGVIETASVTVNGVARDIVIFKPVVNNVFLAPQDWRILYEIQKASTDAPYVGHPIEPIPFPLPPASEPPSDEQCAACTTRGTLKKGHELCRLLTKFKTINARAAEQLCESTHSNLSLLSLCKAIDLLPVNKKNTLLAQLGTAGTPSDKHIFYNVNRLDPTSIDTWEIMNGHGDNKNATHIDSLLTLQKDITAPVFPTGAVGATAAQVKTALSNLVMYRFYKNFAFSGEKHWLSPAMRSRYLEVLTLPDATARIAILNDILIIRRKLLAPGGVSNSQKEELSISNVAYGEITYSINSVSEDPIYFLSISGFKPSHSMSETFIVGAPFHPLKVIRVSSTVEGERFFRPNQQEDIKRKNDSEVKALEYFMEQVVEKKNFPIAPGTDRSDIRAQVLENVVVNFTITSEMTPCNACEASLNEFESLPNITKFVNPGTNYYHQ